MSQWVRTEKAIMDDGEKTEIRRYGILTAIPETKEPVIRDQMARPERFELPTPGTEGRIPEIPHLSNSVTSG